MYSCWALRCFDYLLSLCSMYSSWLDILVDRNKELRRTQLWLVSCDKMDVQKTRRRFSINGSAKEL